MITRVQSTLGKRILVIDDQPRMLEFITQALRDAGFAVIPVDSLAAGLHEAQNDKPSLIVLDLMTPRMAGFDLCKTIKRDPATRMIPILIVSTKNDTTDRIIAFELGVDDYLGKPFHPRELVLRVQAVLRRYEKEATTEPVLQKGEIIVDRRRHEVTVHGEKITLTATEFRLLATLMERRGRTQKRERLLNDVWGYEYHIDTRTIDTHIRRLREKLGPEGHCIETVRGVGYRIAE